MGEMENQKKLGEFSTKISNWKRGDGDVVLEDMMKEKKTRYR